MGWGTYILGGALRGAGEGMLAQLEHDRKAQRELEEARLRRDRILAALRDEVRPEDGAAAGQFALALQQEGDDTGPPRELSLEERWRTAPDTAAPGAAAPASSPREGGAAGGGGLSPDGPATVRTNRLAVILSNPTAQQKEDIDAALPEGVQLRRRQDGGYSAPRKYEGVVHEVLNAGEQPAATDDPTDGIVVNRDAVRAALDSPASRSTDLSFDGLLERNAADAGARHLGKQVFALAKGDPDRANALLAGTFGPTMSEAAKSGSDATFDASFSGGDESGNRLDAVYGPVGDSWTDDLRSFGRYVIDGEAGADGAIPFRWQENEAVMRQVNVARAEFENELLRAGLAPVDVGMGAYNIGTGNGTARDYLVVGGAAAGPILSKTGAVVLPLVTRGGRVAAGNTAVGRQVLYHYTNEAGMTGITQSNSLNPSLWRVGTKDVRYGNGQYVSDIVPGTKTPAQLSREFLGRPFHGNRFTHYVEIDATGLGAVEGRPGVYVVPNEVPLDLTGRLLNSGRVSGQ